MIAKATLVGSYAAAYEKYEKKSQDGESFFSSARGIYNELLEEYFFECQRRGIEIKDDGPETKEALIHDLMAIEEKANQKARGKRERTHFGPKLLSDALSHCEIHFLPESNIEDSPEEDVERDPGKAKYYCFLVMKTVSLSLDEIAILKHTFNTTVSKFNEYEALLCEIYFDQGCEPSLKEQNGWLASVIKIKLQDAIKPFYGARWDLKDPIKLWLKRKLYKNQIEGIELMLNNYPKPITLSPGDVGKVRAVLDSSIAKQSKSIHFSELGINIEGRAAELSLDLHMQKELMGCLVDSQSLESIKSENTYFLSAIEGGSKVSMAIIVLPD